MIKKKIKYEWQRKEQEQSREHIKNDSYEVDGVLYWKCNDAVIPYWVFDDAGLECTAKQRKAHDIETEKEIRAYREAQKNQEVSAEHLHELKANFAPGTVVVDVFTGRKIQL